MSTAAARQTDLRLREPQTVIAELIEIADYIAHLREEIGALRANEMSRDRIPMAHEELGSVVQATAGATNTIMEAAEAMLGLPDGPGYRDAVEERINTIFEACAFQDITGQRIAKVVESLRLFEQRLARFVGKAKAMEMCRTGRMMDAAEAERAGLVSRIIPAADLVEEAVKTAASIAAMAPLAVLANKEMVNAAFETPLAQGIQFERRLFNGLFGTADQKEGMAAFVEKRPGNWSGR